MTTEIATARVVRRRGRGTTKIIAGATIAGLVLLMVLASFLLPGDPNKQVLMERLRPPVFAGGDWSHILGTDQLGRDMLLRLMHGGRVDVAIAILAILLSTALGTSIGVISGYYGKLIDAVTSVVVAVQLAIPSILIILLALTIFGPSILTLGIILALSDWVLYSRTVRGKTLSEKTREYIEAARVLGYADRRIIFRHLLPNVAPTIMVLATMSLGSLILFQASLSFLGVGVQRPNASWGQMVSDGQANMTDGWWIAGLPAITIGILVIGVNLLGDGLREKWKLE